MNKDFHNKILQGDALKMLAELPDESVDCIVTSPPYFGLRDYGMEGQIGLEETPEAYTETLVEVFKEARRALKNEGTLWLNLGDSYFGSWGNYAGKNRGNGTQRNITNGSRVPNPAYEGKDGWKPPTANKHPLLKPKDLVGIPWRVAFALQKDGWYLRQDIIWAKKNVMPESVTDRCTKSHEYVFLLSKSERYYFDNESIKEETVTRDNIVRDRDTTKLNNVPGRSLMSGLKTNNYEKRNKRSVWNVSTKPFKEAHFATFPEELIQPMILAGCRSGGLVLDPFMGAGTTAVVSKKLGRNFVGIELNPEYVSMAEERIAGTTSALF